MYLLHASISNSLVQLENWESPKAPLTVIEFRMTFIVIFYIIILCGVYLSGNHCVHDKLCATYIGGILSNVNRLSRFTVR